MRSLLVFLCLFVSALMIDVTPVSLEKIRGDTVSVTVLGEVEHEGEIELPLYSTVSDALEEAGVRENGDAESLNPSLILKDHDVLYVRTRTEETAEKPVSINSADREELCTLPGIGPSTADNIISYRNEHGLFQSLDEIMLVKGIGTSKFEAISDLITL